MMHGFRNVSEEVLQLLKYYYKKRFLELLPWRIENGIMHNRFFKADCLARFRGQVDYVVFDGVDEYILPASKNLPETLQGLIQYLKKSVLLEDKDACFFFRSTGLVSAPMNMSIIGTSPQQSQGHLRRATGLQRLSNLL